MQLIDLGGPDGPYWERAWELYEASFPPYERRDLASHVEAMGDPHFRCLVVFDADVFVGILFYWRWPGLLYVEHLAIDPSLRGKNYGSVVLQQLIDDAGDDLIMLEIEPPVDGMSQRRLRFYERLGFVMNDYSYLHPSYSCNRHWHPLNLLSFGRQATPDELEAFCRMMNERVWVFAGE
ncbi:MAG: GNAT family N-acetyltransferase [Rikenellaceae bacterium]|nr:GNAT family N-acetyltransferase [Rikenellaceae bacterium]